MSAARSLRAPATDPLLVGLVGLVVYALHGYDGMLTRDLGVFLYGGEHVAAGAPPYVGIFNSVGPLADAVPGLAIRLGDLVGADPLLSARVAFTVLSAGCCALLCVLARDALGSRAAGFLAPAVFLTFESFLQLASDGPREKTTMVLFLVAALVLLGRRHWLAAGACTALATLAWQPVIIPAAAAALVSLLGSRSGRVRGAAAYVAGGALPTAAVVAFYALRGQLGVALDGFVVVNVDYTRQPSLLGTPAAWGRLWNGYHDSLVLVGLGLLGLLAWGLVHVPGAVRRDPRAVGLLALAAGGLAGAVWTTQAVNGAPDLFVLLPFAAVGVTGPVVAAAARVGSPTGRVVLAAVTTAAVAAGVVESVTTRADDLARERGDIASVLAAAPPGATVLSVDAPEVLALARRSNPTPYQVFDRATNDYLDATYPGGLRGYADRVAALRPTLIVTATRSRHGWLRPVLRHDYEPVGHGPTWTWYLLRSAGPHAAAAVRVANASAMRPAGPVAGPKAVAPRPPG